MDETNVTSAIEETAPLLTNKNPFSSSIGTWKNLLTLSMTFMLNYIAYYGLFTLQSSLHMSEGLGTTCASVRFSVFTMSSLFLTGILVRWLGHKWTMTVSLLSFVLWVAANGFGTWKWMVPASVINGVFDAPLWIAQGSYISELSKIHAEKTRQDSGKVSTLFFSVFSAIHCLAAIFGNLISTVILKEFAVNVTQTSLDTLQQCGISDCPWQMHNNTLFNKPASDLVWKLVEVYLAFTLAAILCSIVFVDNIPLKQSKNHSTIGINDLPDATETTDQEQPKAVEKGLCHAALASIKLMKNYKLWLLIPVNMYPAFFSSFRNAEWNRSWVTCSLGIWMVGLTGIPCEVASAPLAFITGYFSSVKGQIVIMIISFLTGIGLILFLNFWTLTQDVWIYYLISAGFGVHQGLFDPIICSIQGITFPNDTVAVYSCHTFFWCLATVATYAYSFYLCNHIKLYLVVCSMLLCYISYFLADCQNCPRS